jgi:hypothetical protein
VPAELLGVDPGTLQLWLTQAQTAMQQLRVGGQPVEVSYGQGDGGTKTVRYTRATIPDLSAYILQLQRALGNIRPRRAIGVRFIR